MGSKINNHFKLPPQKEKGGVENKVLLNFILSTAFMFLLTSLILILIIISK